MADEQKFDTGTAYGMKPREYKKNLVEVGPGTPMGELMRRYWQPCFTSEKLTSDKPFKVRLLGEDLILFRDKEGRPGLVHEHCCHRGTSLFYGRVEEDGIRCCYHGWKFDVKGHCLDQPAEVDGGKNRGRIRQPWYPVEERYGLVYAYMGPPEKKPVLPRWKHLEDLAEDEVIECRYLPAYGDPDTNYEMLPINFNWLQAFENTMDSPHLPWLHFHHSGDQFTGLDFTPGSPLPLYAHIKDVSGTMVVERTELGVKQGYPMPAPDGSQLFAANEAMIPNVARISAFIDLGYFVPADDTHFYGFLLWKSSFHGQRSGIAAYHGGKDWYDLTPQERQKYPGDYEAQESIGKLPAHNLEHLTPGDAAVGMLRRRLEEAVRDVEEGRDPVGISFDADTMLESVGHAFIPFQSSES
jgi:phenylpropionate dioxygenase-like ring-hydroxylating dioxygenase large terminal subunit